MIGTKKRMTRVSLAIALVLGVITLMPVAAMATPLDPFGNGSILLDILSITGDGTNYTYNYEIQTPGAGVLVVTLGKAEASTGELHQVVSISALAPVTATRVTSSSVALSFAPGGLPQGSTYDFSVTYAGFLDDQSISVTMAGDGITKTVKPTYQAVPEPASLVLVGMGLLTVGFLSRRRRRKPNL